MQWWSARLKDQTRVFWGSSLSHFSCTRQGQIEGPSASRPTLIFELYGSERSQLPSSAFTHKPAMFTLTEKPGSQGSQLHGYTDLPGPTSTSHTKPALHVCLFIIESFTSAQSREKGVVSPHAQHPVVTIICICRSMSQAFFTLGCHGLPQCWALLSPCPLFCEPRPLTQETSRADDFMSTQIPPTPAFSQVPETGSALTVPPPSQPRVSHLYSEVEQLNPFLQQNSRTNSGILLFFFFFALALAQE